MAAESKDNTAFTAKEAEVYDRQIRLWGVEAQRRMLASRVLVAGMGGLNCEICKNIALAGINVTVQDDQLVTAADLASQFFLTEADIGKNRAAASLPFIQELNPLATATAVETPLLSQGDEFWADFSLVILCTRDIGLQMKMDALCREKGLQLMIVRACGLHGFLFTDLGTHTYVPTKSKADKSSTKPAPVSITFPSLASARAASWTHLMGSKRKMPPSLFFAALAMMEIEEDLTDAQLDMEPAELETRAAAICKAHGVPEGTIDTALLGSMIACRGAEITPVCAVLGGLVGQEVLKAVSSKDAPLCNLLCFNGIAGDATVVKIGSTDGSA